MQQDQESGGSLDESSDRRLVLLAGDQVALPMSRDRSVVGLGRSFGDIHHAGQSAPPFGGAAGLAQCASGAQALDQLSTQAPAALDVEALVDGLVTHAHRRVVGKQQAESSADLLGAVLGIETILHVVSEPVIRSEFPLLGAAGSLVSQGLGDRRAVARFATDRSSLQLAADRRG